RLGTSVQGRPIDMLVFGNSPGTPVVVMGAIHGDETTSADLTNNLIALLKSRRELSAGKRIAMIPIANPDGYAAKTRLNANRVGDEREEPLSDDGGDRISHAGELGKLCRDR